LGCACNPSNQGFAAATDGRQPSPTADLGIVAKLVRILRSDPEGAKSGEEVIREALNQIENEDLFEAQAVGFSNGQPVEGDSRI
jgi:hypothetical protein